MHGISHELDPVDQIVGLEKNGLIETTVITEIEALKPFKDSWNELSYTVAPKLPSCSYAWVVSYYEHFLESNQSLCCIFAHTNGEMTGVLPLVVTRNAFTGLVSLSTPHSGDLYAVSPLLADQAAAENFDALLECAWNNHPTALWIQLSDVSEKSSCVNYFDDYLHLQIKTRVGRYVSVHTEQESYQSSLSKNFRSNQRKASNRISKQHEMQSSFTKVPAATSEQLAEFNIVEASGWKGRFGTAILKRPELVSFYASLTQRLSETGDLEWHFLRAGDVTIAGHLAIRYNRNMVLWKVAYHEEYKRYSPGSMLFQALLDRVFEDSDIDEVDCMADEDWHNSWKMPERKYFRIRLYRRWGMVSTILGLIPNAMLYIPLKNQRLRAMIQKLRKRD